MEVLTIYKSLQFANYVAMEPVWVYVLALASLPVLVLAIVGLITKEKPMIISSISVFIFLIYGIFSQYQRVESDFIEKNAKTELRNKPLFEKFENTLTQEQIIALNQSMAETKKFSMKTEQEIQSGKIVYSEKEVNQYFNSKNK